MSRKTKRPLEYDALDVFGMEDEEGDNDADVVALQQALKRFGACFRAREFRSREFSPTRRARGAVSKAKEKNDAMMEKSAQKASEKCVSAARGPGPWRARGRLTARGATGCARRSTPCAPTTALHG